MSWPFNRSGDVRRKDLTGPRSLVGLGLLPAPADSTAALQAMVDAGTPLAIPANTTIKVSGTVTCTATTFSLTGAGDGSVLDLSGGGRLVIQSELEPLPGLATGITRGINWIEFAAAHNLAVGDVVIVYNPVDFSFSLARAYYRDGAMFRVSKVDSATKVTFYGVSPVKLDVLAATGPDVPMLCYRMAGGEVVIDNLSIIPPEGGASINIAGHQSVKIGRVLHRQHAGTHASPTGVQISRCYDVDIDGFRPRAMSTSSGDAYPLNIANSQNVRIKGGSFYSNWHCIALGGTGAVGCVPCREIVIDHATLMADTTRGMGSADSHGNCDGVVYSNCTLYGASPSGKNIALLNCTIHGRPPEFFADGAAVYGYEVLGGVFRIHNCTLISHGNNQSFGLIHLVANSIQHDLLVDIRDLTIQSWSPNATSPRILTVNLGPDDKPQRVDIAIDGLVWKSWTEGRPHTVVSLVGLRSIVGKGSVAIDNVSIPSGTELVDGQNAANFAIPMRLPRQTGSVRATTPAARIVGYSTLTFRNPYPRVPAVTMSVSGASSAFLTDSLLGGQAPTAYGHLLSRTGFRPVVGAAANFTAGVEFDLNWVAQIADF